MMLALIFGFFLCASDSLFNIETKKADAIILNDSTRFVITGSNSGRLEVVVRILIKNKEGSGYTRASVTENNFLKVSKIKATIYSVTGDKLAELNEDDIIERSHYPGFMLYNENKAKLFNLSSSTYPQIFEYSYTQKIESLFFFPDFHPQWHLPVEKASHQVVFEDKRYFEFKGKEKSPDPIKFKNEDGDSVYYWSVNNLPSSDYLEFAEPGASDKHSVQFKAKTFKLNEFEGSNDSWLTFGDWYYQLWKDRLNLKKGQISDIFKEVDVSGDKKSIISNLYTYLQNKTRYVAISLDIGGWQPHHSSETFECRYGDCKDLSTLMVDMLAHAGINAYPALALTRDNGRVDPAFPSNQFNHQIVMVPLETDTLWLECTADHVSAFDIPYSIENTYALVVKKGDSQLIKIPASQYPHNAWRSHTVLEIDENGMMNMQTRIRLTGNQKDYFASLFQNNTSEDIKTYFNRRFGHPYQFTIDQYNYMNQLDTLTLSMSGYFINASKKLGSRLMVSIPFLNRSSKSMVPDTSLFANRVDALYLGDAYDDMDIIEFKLPAGYFFETGTGQSSIESPFAAYSHSWTNDESTIQIKRSYQLKTPQIPIENGYEYVRFIEDLLKVDEARFVLKKK